MSQAVNAQAIRDWLVQHLAALLRVDQASIDPCARFSELGVDSTAAISLTGALSDWLDADIEPDLALIHNSIDAVAEHVAARLTEARA